MTKFIKKFWPIIFLVFFWFIFASPYFLKAKAPFPSTYQVNFFPPWSSYPHNGMPVKNNAMPDVITQIYPWRHLAMEIWKSGQIPLWNPYSFGGTPLLANYQSAVLSPFNILFFIFPFVDGWSLLVLLQPLLAGFFTYLFARKLSVSKTGSILSAISFMFCGFLVVWMSYATLGYAILFLPLGLYALEGYFKEEKRAYLFLLAATFPLSFFSGHFQISLYFAITIFSYWLYLVFSSKSKQKSIRSGLVFFFGFLLTMPQLIPSMEFYTQSLRSSIYVRIEVIPWAYLPTLLAPDFFGNAVTRNDWFGHYAEWNGYTGVLPFFLSLLAISVWKKHSVKFFLSLGIIALLLAFPTPLGDALVWLKIPVLATSAASRIIVLFSFSVAVLAGFGLDKLKEDFNKKNWKTISYVGCFGVIVFFVLWTIVLGKLFMPVDKIAIAKQNLFLPTAFFLSGIGIIITGFLSKKIRIIVFFLIILLTSFDMLRFVNKWQPFDPKSLVFEPVGATAMFAKIAGYQRVLGNYDEHVPVYYHLPSMEGYDPLYPKRSGEFAESLFDGTFREGERSVVTFPKYGTYTKLGLDLLGFTYIAHKKSDDNKGWTFQYWKYPASDFPVILEDSAYRILENKSAYPRAFLATNYKVITEPQKILNYLFDKTNDIRNTIVLEKQPSLSPEKVSEESLRIVSYSPDVVTLRSGANGNTLLFLSDTFYPGWHTYVDGKEVEILRADLAFRAIALSKGNHTIVFRYAPLSFILGIVAFCVGILGLTGVFLTKRR